MTRLWSVLRRAAAVGGLAAVAAGCASAPDARYYTLDMNRSGEALPTVNLEVEALRAADTLTRPQIMIQASPTRVEYYAVDQWAGSLSELVTRKLRTELGPPEEGRRTMAVSGTLLECGQVDVAGGAEAELQLRLTVRDAQEAVSGRPLLERTYSCRRRADAVHPEAVAVALSRCLETIAAELAVDAGTL